MMGSIKSKLGLLFCLLLILSILCGCKQVIVSTRGLQRLLELDPGGQCTNAEEIQITVSGPGTIVVTAHAMFGLKSHTRGQNDLGMLFISDIKGRCDYNTPLEGSPMGFSIAADVPSWTASSAKLIPVSLSGTFHVGEAGEYKYYLNGRNVAQHGSLKVWSSTLNAVFYPE